MRHSEYLSEAWSLSDGLVGLAYSSLQGCSQDREHRGKIQEYEEAVLVSRRQTVSVWGKDETVHLIFYSEDSYCSWCSAESPSAQYGA